MDQVTADSIGVALPLVLLVVAFFVGELLEQRHYKAIRRREERWKRLPLLTFDHVPGGLEVTQGELVTSGVVVSVDYFKRFLAGLRQIFGGRIRSYESLMDRARRESLLRLKEVALRRGYHAVINVRLETSRLASSTRKGKGTAGLEVMAFGTAVKVAKSPS